MPVKDYRSTRRARAVTKSVHMTFSVSIPVLIAGAAAAGLNRHSWLWIIIQVISGYVPVSVIT
jgi:hypothetical protein